MSRVRLVLWRHGQTDWNVDGRFQGQADVPLNETGLAQAEAAAGFVAAYEPTRIISSDLGRARTTAEALARRVDLPVGLDPRLRELHTGEWTGLTFAQVTALDPAFEVAIREGRDYRRSGGGETVEETAERSAAALAEIAAGGLDGQTIAVVGHGLSLRVGIARLLGLDFRQSWGFGGFHNCAWSLLGYRGDRVAPYAPWSLLAYNLSVPDLEPGRAGYGMPNDVAAPDRLQGPSGR